ncbi:uncharacterized protein LOC132545545 [Ylistrum balloti]|uniref:uncharacterized protein LOC132545545 n=1 Tax=Ylistrum balloti TaxID=509963 RepID=UPI002905F468|nr:uncharacterized protein LOC132545545 [Ylistrum balloti]
MGEGSRVVRDVWRYHHWPPNGPFTGRDGSPIEWLEEPVKPFEDQTPMNAWRKQVERGEIKKGVDPNFIGYDPSINQYNREKLRYHHWPARKDFQQQQKPRPHTKPELKPSENPKEETVKGEKKNENSVEKKEQQSEKRNVSPKKSTPQEQPKTTPRPKYNSPIVQFLI